MSSGVVVQGGADPRHRRRVVEQCRADLDADGAGVEEGARGPGSVDATAADDLDVRQRGGDLVHAAQRDRA